MAYWATFCFKEAMKLELYYFEMCPYCQIVLRKIDQLGIRDQIEYKDTMSDPQNAKFHFEKTGVRTVPCLYIDGRPMFESMDIARWLEDKFKKD